MAKLTIKEIRDLARKIVASNPGGIRRGELFKQISDHAPETNPATIDTSVWNLERLFPSEIAKPSRGLFMPRSALDGNAANRPLEEPSTNGVKKSNESDFYEPFAKYLKEDLDEATEAVSLGGAGLKTKWGTPDVVGIYRPSGSDLIRFQPEIIAAEIKTDPEQPVVAFGQAMSYQLFSTKTYVVMPNPLNKADKDRLEALCLLSGIGLVLFDLNLEKPNFAIRVRAQRRNPDMFYVNEFAEGLKQHDREKFKKLFP